MSKHFFIRDALPPAVRSTIWDLLAEVAEHRPLTRDEIHLRRSVGPLPWRDLDVDRSTWYRRRKRALLAIQSVQAA